MAKWGSPYLFFKYFLSLADYMQTWIMGKDLAFLQIDIGQKQMKNDSNTDNGLGMP